MKLRVLITALLLSLLCLDAGAQANEQKSRKAKLEKEIRVLEDQLRTNRKKSDNAEAQIRLLNKKIENRRELLKNSEAELKAVSDSLEMQEREIAAIRSRLDTMYTYYSRLVRNAYKNRDSKMWYMYLLASENIAQASRRYGYLRSLSTQMNSQARRICETRDELEKRQEELLEMQRKAKSIRDACAYELDKLKGEEADSKKLAGRLQSEKKKYQNQLSQKRKQVDALDKEIAKLIAQSMGDAGKGKTKTSSKIDSKLSNEFAANCGKLPWPVEGVVVDHFGQRMHPVYKSVKLPFNNGVNVATPKDAKVSAIFDGEVRQIIVMPGYNQCVLIQHGEYFTFYCKLGSVAVKSGDKVKIGQTIGTVASNGSEIQLHFQLWQGRSPQDPEIWLLP